MANLTKRLKIAIVVHGRFHAFELAREMLQRGHEVKVFTNFPGWATQRFGLPGKHVASCSYEGVASRLLSQAARAGLSTDSEPLLHRWFGRWAAKRVAEETWDVVLCWSGVAEETFRALKDTRSLLICHRSSSHIRTQGRLLEEEEARTGVPQERPSVWMSAREQREYQLADLVYVPSSFAHQSFRDEGEDLNKVITIQHGVDTRFFRPSLADVEARCARILSGSPLRVLNVGTFCFRKGIWDFADVIQKLGTVDYHFRFVGPINPEASNFSSKLRPEVDFVPPQPQSQLPIHYRWGDIFVLPTIEDGFPFVLAQAHAAALPILTTPNGAGNDLISNGENGWVLPIRDPRAIEEKLRWCKANRDKVVAMVKNIYQSYQIRDWRVVAEEFESMCYSNFKTEVNSSIQYAI